MRTKHRMLFLLVGVLFLSETMLGCGDESTSVKLQSISINELTLQVGQTKSMAVSARYDDGSTKTISSGVIYFSNSAAVSIAGSNITGVSAAPAVTISAEYQGKTANLTIAVTAAQVGAFVVFDDGFGADVNTDIAYWNGENGFSVTSNESIVYAGSASLQIDYSAVADWNGFPLETNTPVDLSMYNALTLWARGDVGAEIIDKFGFASGTALEISVIDVELSTQWQKIVVPIPNQTRLAEVQGVFFNADGAGEKLYVDNVQFESVDTLSLTSVNMPILTKTLVLDETYLVPGVVANFDNGGDTITLTTGLNAYCDWASSDEQVATVDSSGTVTAAGEGTATITASIAGVAAVGEITVEVVTEIDADTNGDGTIALYGTTVPVDSGFGIVDWSSGSTLDPNYSADSDYNPVYQVVEGAGWGTPNACIAFSGFGEGFAQGYTNLHFKIKNLPADSVAVKFSSNGNPETELAFDLATYAVAIEGTSGWLQVTIPLSSFADHSSYTEFAILGGWGLGGTFYVTDIYID